jgi:hypothetical protein
MQILNSRCAAAASALLLCLVATVSDAQNTRAPIIRVSSQNGAGVASNYVSPVIDLGEDAYVFAVSVDLDGQIQVLHPELPGISVRLRRDQQFRLPNFFAGFSRSGGGVIAPGRYSSYSSVETDNDTRGTVIALASRVPFNLDRVARDGDWNIAEIRNLVENRAPLSAAAALASYLGTENEPVGLDYMRFASVRGYQYGGYASDALYGCDLYYGGYSPALSFNRIGLLAHVARLQRAGQNVRIVGYDFCGMPIIAFGPSRTIARANPRPPREPADSGKTKREHFPRHTPEAQPGQPTAAIGYLPKMAPRMTPQGAEVTAAPLPRSRLGGEVLIDNRNQVVTVPERRVAPTEHVAPPRNQPAMGTVQRPEYSRPIVREAPPPPRAEPTRTASPPPRVETPRSVTPRVEATPAPPPPRQKQ